MPTKLSDLFNSHRRLFIGLFAVVILLPTAYVFRDYLGFLPGFSGTETINGTITSSTNECWIGSGVCSVEVDDNWTVIVAYGPDAKETDDLGDVGMIEGITGSNSDVGKQVEVYGKVVSENEISIYGNEDYYIRILE